MDERTPRQLAERTGRHDCIRCLGDVPAEIYLRNDHLCDECAVTDEAPPPTTPAEKKCDEG